MSDKYFRLDVLESDPTKLLEWLTDYDTQKLIAHHFETHQVFFKDSDGNILVYEDLKFYYNLWFDKDNTLKSLGINLPSDTE